MKKLIFGLLLGLLPLPFAFGQAKPPHLVDESIRGYVGTGANTLILGFYIKADNGQPTTLTKRCLIRGSGPALRKFGVADAANDPVITVFDAKGNILASNDNWNTDPSAGVVASQVGAFAFENGSKDAALVIQLPPGAYTAQLKDPSSIGSEALLEVYDASQGTDFGILHLANMSDRTGYAPATLGFIMDGIGQMRVLVRAVGPGLRPFGLSSILADPKLTVYDKAGVPIVVNDNWGTWSTDLTPVFTQVGAFPLAPGSTDSAAVLTIGVNGPTSITARVTSASGGTTTDTVNLMELYTLD
ncbi:MAG TPA: hypothetical protein VFT82_01315 [Candidatus Paceibacterota bacterium]|nr:hypothetical protein [Candidatus Paceibacterota bacterium]